ncbi:MAG: M14 family zinc carboxypeptidase [Sphingobacteriaceae bacterium]
MVSNSISHSLYRDPHFSDRFFKHHHLIQRLNELQSSGLFTIDEIGQSFNSKSVNLIKIGKGEIPILLWSQMHGDEPTGTMALFDLLNFLSANDEHNAFREQILNSCTLYMVPMLNPDGAEVYERRNAQGIDINRDFIAQQTSEAKILIEICDEVKPEFGFNLHDQSSLWTVSGSKHPAAISLLAPPVDDAKSIPACRLKAIQIITAINKELQKQIPGQVGRWLDEYEPRAVGECFQEKGIATILVEAGGYVNDLDKQFVRKLNFDVLVCALEQIVSGLYVNEDVAGYFSIPANNKEIFHLLIRNCTIQRGNVTFKADIGLNYTEVFYPALMRIYTVADFGDLSTWNAYEILEADETPFIKPIVVDEKADFTIRTTIGELRFVNGLLI